MMRLTESKLRRIIRQVISEASWFHDPKSHEVGRIYFVIRIIQDVCRERGLICIQDPDNDIYIGKQFLDGIVVRVGNTAFNLKDINFSSLFSRIRDCGSELECRRVVEAEIKRCCM